MFPTPPTPPQAPQRPPKGRGGNAGQSERVRAMLVDVLMRAKQMAEQNGIDFADVLSEVMGAKGGGGEPPMMGGEPLMMMG